MFLSGCALAPKTKENSASASVGNLLLVEPEEANPRSQMAIARYNHILSQAPLKPDERAELMFQRGMLYDSVGLSGLARYDYSQALKLKPDMAEAHNSIGIHYVQEMDFMQAYESFDSSLDLNPDYDFAILNRGIALYYGGRAELAAQDMRAFYELEPEDPYRVLWYFIALRAIDEAQAIQALAKARKSLQKSNWAHSLVDFYLGKASEKQVMTTLLNDVTSQKQLNDRLCEAYFYMGKYHASLGNGALASNYFKLALSTNVYEYVEHRYARIELNLLRKR